MTRWAKREPEDLERRLSQMNIGGSSLGKLAIQNLAKQIMALAAPTNESILPVGELVDFLLETKTKTDKTIQKVLRDWADKRKRAQRV